MNKKSASRRPRRQPRHRLKPLYAAVLLAFSVQTAQANPIGGSVVNGSASFATAGNTLTVTNTPGTIINWQGFSINSNEITNFAQQTASSTVLNRVVGSDPSNILGTLRSNGRVFLVNPNGIMFGAGAVVDVAGLVASTLNLSNADFLAGNNHFTQVPGAGNISNAGNITAQQGGQIYLIAPNVENTGVITAPNGEILLAAGYSVDLVSTDDPNLRVNITAPAGNATNVGQLVASAGSLGLFGTVVSNSGIVSADSATLQGGKIVFKASQLAEISGTVSATGVQGGDIQILGKQVALINSANVDASGINGGGTVLVGGDAHGANAAVQNAQQTFVSSDSTIKADAVQTGDGGKVVVWADGATQFGGNISARGGAVSGNGGWVEVSGKQWLGYAGLVNTTAANGMVGSLLLDPTDITIGVGLDSTSMTYNAGVFTDPATTPSNLNVTTLTNQLALSNVTVDTSSALAGTGNITIADSLIYSSPNTLTLNAAGAGSIFVNTNTSYLLAVIQLQIGVSGGGSLVMQTAGGSIGIGAAAGVTITGGGSFTANAGGATSDVIINSVINTGAGAINLTAGQSVTELTGGSLTTTGLLTTKSAISTTLDSANSVGSFAATNTGGGSAGIISLNNTATNWTLLGINQTSSGSVTLTNSGIITPTGAVSTGSFTLSGGTWDQVSATLPGFTASTGFNIATGATFIRALGGDGVNNPYQLADIYGVQGIGSVGMLGNSYVLANDIDASVTAGWLNANGSPVGLVPIGVAYPGISFTGQFDGQGHTISNLYINQPGVNDVGLFGYASSGSISNVGLVNASVSGASNVGGLVGSNYYGNISNSYVSGGTISATGNNVGGLVGNYSNSTGGTISNSYVYNGTIVTGASNVGGLVGNSQYGSIHGSHVDGVTVTGSGSAIGGLVGNNNSSFDGGSGVSIINSYVNNGTVSGASSVGGLVGYNSGGNISGSYVNGGTVNATGNYAGGLVGNNRPDSWGNISSSNVTGVGVTGGSYVGGLVGFNGTGSISGTASSVGNTIAGSYVSGGTVSASGSYVGGLVGSNAGTVSGSYVNGTTVITSLNDTSANAGGLVGDNSGTIDNSYASNVSVSDNATIAYDLGGLVGSNSGTISTSYASNGTVSSKSEIGGLVGNNSGGTINTSFASNMTVSGSNTIGGLVGSNSGSISNTYASGGTISGSSTVGGLVGYDTGSISTSYASVGISAGGTNVGGLVGYTYGGTFSNNFWNTTIETAASSGIGYDGLTLNSGVDAGGVVFGMSDANMKTLANFTSATAANGNVDPGWDFTTGTIWHITEGVSMPLLPFSPATVVATPSVINELVDITDQRPKRNEVDVLVASTSPGDSGNQQTLPMCN